MKTFFLLIMAIAVMYSTCLAQTPSRVRSVLSTGGSSGEVSTSDKTFYYQHSIGQPSITGISGRNTIQLRQGFIQPVGSYGREISKTDLPVVIYPNPFPGKLTLKFNENISGRITLSIYDLNGRILFEKRLESSDKQEIDLTFLPPSVYFMKVSAGARSSYSKLIRY
ncbi:MAG: T9SS type A sorting domain-containing protein [Bacteroidales bacterium]